MEGIVLSNNGILPLEDIKKVLCFYSGTTENDLKSKSEEEIRGIFGKVLDANLSIIIEIQDEYDKATGNEDPMLVTDLLIWNMSQTSPKISTLSAE